MYVSHERATSLRHGFIEVEFFETIISLSHRGLVGKEKPPQLRTFARELFGQILLVAATLTLGFGLTTSSAIAATFIVTTVDDPVPDGCLVDDCSLREAVGAANGNGEADSIDLPAGHYVLALGDIDILFDDVTINGAGAKLTILDGNDSDRIFEPFGSIVNLTGLTIQNGRASFGGAILADGLVTITDSTIKNNVAIGPDGGGGGIFLFGTALRDGLVLQNCTVTGNSAEAASPSLLAGGGGIWVGGSGASKITNSTISGNSAALNGGGIKSAAFLEIINTTVTDNSSQSGAGIIDIAIIEPITFTNTIVANNVGGEDCVGVLSISTGHNLDGDGTCPFTQPDDLSGVNPLIGPLQDNGGPTFTHALLPGSPAIDRANNLISPMFDQRGFPRFQDGDGNGSMISDIGAYEFQPSLGIAVEIDVKPGSDPNCFNVNGHGVIPVAVLGSESFDVSDIDQNSLSFGGAGVRVRGNKGPLCGLEDVNSDGFYDLVCHFEDNPELWEPGQADATLTGALLDGTSIAGTDSICIVP